MGLQPTVGYQSVVFNVDQHPAPHHDRRPTPITQSHYYLVTSKQPTRRAGAFGIDNTFDHHPSYCYSFTLTASIWTST